MAKNIADTEMSTIILSEIIKNDHFANKVIPELRLDFFVCGTERVIAQTLIEHQIKFGSVPTIQEVVATIKENHNVNGLDRNVITDVFRGGIDIQSQDWLINQTERFIRRRRTSIAFEETFGQFEEGSMEVDGFYMIFQEAASFSFNTSVGMSLVGDANGRYEVYTEKVRKTKFYIAMLDMVTGGGMEDGTLNCILAGTNTGKSLLMGYIAAEAAKAGLKVLVISLEMAEIKLIERIEAHLMDVPIKDFKKQPREEYYLKQGRYIDAMKLHGGDIIFRQYPTRTAHAGHFKNLIIECKNKLGYTFDLVVIDYLNICATQTGSRDSNSYTEVKTIAEELRAMAVEFSLPILTATQTNRSGQDAADLTLDNVSESHGLSATVDFFIALITTEEWEAQGKVQLKQLKSRYGDKGWYNKFFVGVDKKYMRFYDLPEETQNTIVANRSITPEPSEQKFDLSSLSNN